MDYFIVGYAPDFIGRVMDILQSMGVDAAPIILLNKSELLEDARKEWPELEIIPLEGFRARQTGQYIMGVTGPAIKHLIYADLLMAIPEAANSFPLLVHSYSHVAKNVTFGKGGILEAGSLIANNTQIGDFVSVNRQVNIGHHNCIGDYSTISPGVTICGRCTVGSNTIIGPGVTIVNGVTIGDNTIIGAGSVVTRPVPANVIAWGNPCKAIKANQPVGQKTLV